jgi:hypothetical protein
MVSTLGRREWGMGRASTFRSTPWMRWSVDTVLIARGDDTACHKKAQDRILILGSGSKNLWPLPTVVTRKLPLGGVPSLARHQRLSQNPHLVERDCHHDEEAEHHECVSRQHGQDENRRDVADEPRRDEIENDTPES